ncbi:MAG: LacI family DNA-binding transcriptional regulator [Actinobacteria bacterium]|nr:LacI family DNA-binding transcriptional regulator [Actinomycetota bacterium]
MGGPAPKRTRIGDVARAAGVSKGTVSRVLNHHPDVSPVSRQRVTSAIARLRYMPSPVARALSRRSTRAIGILIPDLADPVFMQMVRGVEGVASGQNYAVMLGESGRSAAKEVSFCDLMSQFLVAGVLIAGGTATIDREFARHVGAIPTVVLGRRSSSGTFPASTVDHCAGGRAAIQYLLELGHRRIGLVGGDQASEAGVGRQRGYLDALRAWDVPPEPALMQPTDFALASGMAATARLLDARPAPTAVWFASDELALGGLRVIKDRGLRIPADISVAGFNDIPYAAISDPPLTTMRWPAKELGTVAMRMLAELIETGGPVHDATFTPELVVRASTAPPAA